ncbi:MAG: hypothetical protein K0R11_262 [Acidimicrobiales bacterium]|nr:hypothetical protein [Acidimicrobiales bacterium]
MRLLVVVALGALLAACGGDGERAAPPDRPVDSAGPVSDVTATSVRIDEATGVVGPLAGRVDEDTVVLRREGDDYDVATIDDVRVGDRVEVWVDGPVAESSPVQAHAAVVVLAP